MTRGVEARARELPTLDLRAPHAASAKPASSDDDGVIRRIPLWTQIGSGCYRALRSSRVRIDGNPPSGVRLGARRVELWRGPTRTAVDSQGRMLVDYQQRSQRDHRDLSLAALAAGRVDLTMLRDRVVLLGASARPFGQFHSTPLVSQIPMSRSMPKPSRRFCRDVPPVPARRLVQF
jgi:CHASE2 domain-containing sensor protein